MNRPQWAAVGSPALAGLEKVLDFGTLGVPLFFVISGFCIHLRWAKARAEHRETKVGFVGFWKRRLYRLYPPYLAALSLTMGFVAVRLLAGFPLSYPGSASRDFGIDAVLHLLMLHGLHPDFDYEGGNVVYWTLAREEYLYLMYFALLAFRRRFSIPMVAYVVFVAGVLGPLVVKALVLAVSGGASWWSIAWYPFRSGNSALALWLQWTLGAVAVESYLGLVRLPWWTRSMPLVVVWAVVAHWSSSSPVFGHLTPSLWGMTFFTLLNAAVWRESVGFLNDTKAIRLFRWLGLFSYSLYLIHLPILMVLQKIELIIRARLPFAVALTQSWVYHIAAWSVFVVATCCGAYVFFWIVERRFLNRA